MNKIALVLVLAIVAVCYAEESKFQTWTFKQVIEDRADKLVVFVKPAEQKSIEMLTAAEEAAARISEKYPKFGFVKVDASDEANAEQLQNARFSDYPYCFLATSEGVERVPDHLDANGLFKAVADKFEPVSYDDVVTITSAEEFEKLSGPRMIKYFEQWCGHCKAAKKPYAKAATQLKGQAILAEIECSLNDETKAICQENDVQGYPTIKFVDAEDEEVDFQGPRTVGGFSEFVLARVSKPAAAAAPEAEVASAEHEHDEL